MGIKIAQPEMFEQIDQLLRDAFTQSDHGYGGEAELTKALRESDTPTIELAAVEGNEVIGVALLSEAKVGDIKGLVLAPLAVKPANQKEGVGSALMDQLDELAIDNGYAFISILGDAYYTQFGYETAEVYGVKAPMDVPSEYFHLKTFGTVDTGTLAYAPEFGI